MSREPSWLAGFKRDVHSQGGEDGVIAKLLETLPESDKWCVEFGAWDGIHLSNTRHLIVSGGYSSVQIEGSRAKCAELAKNYAANSKVIPVNAFVGFDPHDGLDAILARHPIPRDFDFLSIDVDGNDYHIWKAVVEYRPKAVCIEFNPTVPTELRFVQRADPRVHQGAGLRSLVELGKEKGYELVCALTINAFFVDAKYFPLFGIADNRAESLRTDLSHVTYLYSGYDGALILEGSRQLPWHLLPISPSALQPLPGFLRKYPGDYNRLEFRAYRMLVKYARLKQRLRKIWLSLRRGGG
jgi:hypothetical protein